MTALPTSVKKIHVVQGEYVVVDDATVVLGTILGSCVAACLRDPEAGIGGMNHFLLPGDVTRAGGGIERYGVHLMELLINGLLKRGAQRQRLEGKLFGGARMLDGLSDIGAKNATFAKSYFKDEGIKLVAEDLGGRHGRRIEYYPVSGRARQIFLSGDPQKIHLIETPSVKPSNQGAVELF